MSTISLYQKSRFCVDGPSSPCDTNNQHYSVIVHWPQESVTIDLSRCIVFCMNTTDTVLCISAATLVWQLSWFVDLLTWFDNKCKLHVYYGYIYIIWRADLPRLLLVNHPARSHWNILLQITHGSDRRGRNMLCSCILLCTLLPHDRPVVDWIILEPATCKMVNSCSRNLMSEPITKHQSSETIKKLRSKTF